MENVPLATKKKSAAKPTRTKRATPAAAKKKVKPKKASPKKRPPKAQSAASARSTSKKTTAKPTKSNKSNKSIKSNKSRKSAKQPVKARQATQTSSKQDELVTVDRRRSRERRKEATSEVAQSSDQPKLERRKKVQRRRQIDPTTCERDYSIGEVEFMSALDQYKRKSGRMFPTCSEILEVIHALGYVKLSSAELSSRNSSQQTEEKVEADSVGSDNRPEGYRESCDLEHLQAVEILDAHESKTQEHDLQWTT